MSVMLRAEADKPFTKKADVLSLSRKSPWDLWGGYKGTPQVLPPASLSRQASQAFGCTTGLDCGPSLISAHWLLRAP